jgi:hypothetical protein
MTTATAPAEVTARFVKPRLCSRCRGEGLVSSRVVYAGGPGGCFKCDGWGWVEGDRATIEAAKARTAAMTGMIRDSISALEAAGLTPRYSTDLCYGIDHLATNAPARYESALQSYLAGHPGLARALWAYTAEAGFVHYGTRNLTAAEALALLTD